MALTIHAHLSMRLKKEYSYTFTPPMGFYALLYGELQLKFICIHYCGINFVIFPSMSWSSK
jgi:hypothetical protein